MVNTGQSSYIGLNTSFRIDQANELIYDLLAIIFEDGDLRDTFFIIFSTGGFYVDYRVNNFNFKY